MKTTTIITLSLLLALSGLARAADKKTEPVGTWKLEYMIGDQQRTATLAITKDGDKLAGTMTWPDQKAQAVKDLKLKENELTYSAERKVGDNEFHIEYTLTIDGDAIKGKGAVENNGQKTDFDIAGKREKKDKEGGPDGADQHGAGN